MQETINALLAAVAILVMTQITQFIRSITNRHRIEAVEQNTAESKEDARKFREKIEQEKEALNVRITKESLDRIDVLVATLERKEKEHELDRIDWREDRAEWKTERTLRDARDKLVLDQVDSLKRELEAVRRELKRVGEESSERETVIKEQSKIIEAQTETISRHETTISEQAARIDALETQVAELEKARVEAINGKPGAAARERDLVDNLKREVITKAIINPNEKPESKQE